MKLKSWLLLVPSLMLFLAVIDFFFIHLLFPVKRQAHHEELQRTVNEELLKNPPSTAPSPSDP